MFLHLAVILFTGGRERGLPTPHRMQTPWGWVDPPPGCRSPRVRKTPPWMQTPPRLGQTPQMKTPWSWADPSRCRSPWTQTPPPPVRSTSGRYVSYWNGYLLLFTLISHLPDVFKSKLPHAQRILISFNIKIHFGHQNNYKRQKCSAFIHMLYPFTFCYVV